MNWRKIKAEYIAGGISQRAIAKKYGVPFGTLQKRARVEKWHTKRQNADDKAVEEVTQKTAEIVADNATLLERAKRSLLMRVVSMIEEFPDTKAGEMRERIGNTDYVYKIKDLAAVINSLTDGTQKGQSADIEDLAPLGELLKDE